MVREGRIALNGFLRIETAIAQAAELLRESSESPRLDAELLLARALDVPRSYLFAHADEEMDSAAADRYRGTVDMRADNVPLAYITGEKEFWSMMLTVSPATLVPRPETELLVDQALMRIPREAQMRILDMGTGSGAIALAIARERPNCDVIATDISEEALQVARINARQHALPNVEFLHGNWTEPVRDQTFDIVVCNPPYVANDDAHLDRLRHEPRQALAAGSDGLDAIRVIAVETVAILNPGGTLLIEHGETQQAAIEEILAANSWTNTKMVKDLGGLPRITITNL